VFSCRGSAYFGEYLRTYWIEFHNLMKALYMPMMGLYFIFQFVRGRCHGNQIMLPKWRQTDTTCISCTFAGWQHGFVLLRLATNATVSCKILVKISPVVLVEDILIKIALRVHVVVRHISSNISGFTGLIFTIFSPYERTLCADDESIPYFPIYQGTLPWQPNNIAVMKANWYYTVSQKKQQWCSTL